MSIMELLSYFNFTNIISVGDVALIVTLVVAFFYALFTFGLWKEAQFQSQLSLSPFILIDIDSDNNIYVNNIGNGYSLDITMENFFITMTDTKQVHQLLFQRLRELGVKEKKKLNYLNYINGSLTQSDISVYLNPEYQRSENIILTLTYKDILGKKYITRFKTGRDNIKILKMGRITIFDLLKINLREKYEEIKYRKYIQEFS